MSKPTKTHPHHSVKDLTKREHIAIQWLLNAFANYNESIDSEYYDRHVFEDAVRAADYLIEELNKKRAPKVEEDDVSSDL